MALPQYNPNVQMDDCADGAWGPPPESPFAARLAAKKRSQAMEAGDNSLGADESKEKAGDSSSDKWKLRMGFLWTLFVVVPTILGSWCWPVIVIGFLQSALNLSYFNSNPNAKQSWVMFFQMIMPGMNFAVFTNMMQWMWNMGRRPGGAPNAYRGPVLCVFFAMCMLMFEQVDTLFKLSEFDFAHTTLKRIEWVKTGEGQDDFTPKATWVATLCWLNQIGGTITCLLAILWYLAISKRAAVAQFTAGTPLDTIAKIL